MRSPAPGSLLFIGKRGDFYCDRAVEFVRLHFPRHEVVLGRRGDPLPAAVESWEGDHMISYLSPWIIPRRSLDRVREASLNFHPGPPEYPGIGCTNFAIYHEAPTFGVTCHHMAPKVDTGSIVAVRRFPLLATDSVWSLTQRCYSYILTLFYEIASRILEQRPLPASDESWQRRPYRRKELDALCRITPEMSEDEVARRVRAVTFPGAPGAYRQIGDRRVPYETPGE